MAKSESQDQLILRGALTALITYLLPWVQHRTAALAFNGRDLGAWVAVYPPEWSYDPKFLTPLLLNLVPASAAVILALWAQLRPDRAGRFTAWATALLISLWLIPPAEFFRGGWNNLNHRQQFALCVGTVALILLSNLIRRWPGRYAFILIGLASAIGIGAGLWGLYRAARVVNALYGPFRPGPGAIATVTTLGVTLAGAVSAWRASGHIPPGELPLAVYRDLSRLRHLDESGELNAKKAAQLVPGAAASVLAYYHRTGGYLGQAVELLTGMSTSDDPELAALGLRGMFPWLVERLSDAFDPEYCLLYDRAFAHVIDLCRKLPDGRELDSALSRFGLQDPDAMLARKERLRSAEQRLCRADCKKVKKALVLSRVTVGAEVAVTSVILQRIGAACPNAERVLLGAEAMGQLFAGERGIRVRDIPYGRNDGLIGRLNNWLPLIEAISDELSGLEPDEYIVIDPDSRLTQLGLLPVVPGDRRYLFFESRGYRREGVERIGELTAAWLDERFWPGPKAMPFVNPAPAHRELGKALRARINQVGRRPIVSISFGVGGNPHKRLPESIEYRLLRRLLSRGYAVLIARGVGEDETTRTDRHLARLRGAGHNIISLRANRPGDLPERLEGDVIAWEGELGAFCGMICAGDVYLGYDSAGQHIAAAMGVPVVDIFADRSKPMVIQRWRPWGPGPVVTLMAGNGRDMVSEVIRAVGGLMRR